MIESLKIIVQFYISIPKNSMYLEFGTTAQNKTFYFFIQNLSYGFNLSKEPNHSIDKREFSLGFYFKEQTTFKKVSEIISKDWNFMLLEVNPTNFNMFKLIKSKDLSF